MGWGDGIFVLRESRESHLETYKVHVLAPSFGQNDQGTREGACKFDNRIAARSPFRSFGNLPCALRLSAVMAADDDRAGPFAFQRFPTVCLGVM